MKYKAVIFDLDGTLLDTIQDIADSCNASLRSHNYEGYLVDEYKYFVGRGVDELISIVLEKGGIDPVEFDSIKKGYMQAYRVRSNTHTKPYLGMIDLLKNLKSYGIKVNILSNKPHHQTIKVVKHYFKDFSFDFVYGKKPEFQIKPNPESLNDMIKKLNLAKNEILYVGDTNTDIQTAKNANLTSVGVLWGFRNRLELANEGATFIVENPEEIIDIVKGD